MRLINCISLRLEEFNRGSEQVPAYAILSHTWDNDEVTFADLIEADDATREQAPRFRKIRQTCKLALADALDYAWVDTCCIDKSSSSELSEAINSMFQWYSNAEICYVWLADLPAHDPLSVDDPQSRFQHCRWFTRGWTLQELLAPSQANFYDCDWRFRGTKKSMHGIIAQVTRIPTNALLSQNRLFAFPVAQRMSWAARRQTTRIEDMAYCLLAIFDVNLSLLYGEGERAFLRLQEEIARQSNDLSLFAWTEKESWAQKYWGIFAMHPSAFLESNSIESISSIAFNPEYTLTNKGLRIKTDLYKGSDGGTQILDLNCSQLTDHGSRPIGLYLRIHDGGVYSRVRADQFSPVDPNQLERSTRNIDIYIHKRITFSSSLTMALATLAYGVPFMLRRGFDEASGEIQHPDAPYCAVEVGPIEYWNPQKRMFLIHGLRNFTGFAVFESRHMHKGYEGWASSFILAFGKAQDQVRPWYTIETVPNESYPGGSLASVKGDLKRLGTLGRRRYQRSNSLKGVKGFPSYVVQVNLVQEDGVNCIDLSYEPTK